MTDKEKTDEAELIRGVSPCDAWRQFLAEFSPGVSIAMVNSETPEHIHKSTLTELRPHCGTIIGRSNHSTRLWC